MQIKGSRLILYDKSGVFLGMGNQELYLLGYEDMEEFRNYHNDFADLFVNKPGYIFKFQNFSWIDYTLHSGTPNRKVLIKSKNGKEIETSLTINEIFLNKEISGASVCFCIELNASSLKKELSNKSETFNTIQEEPQSFTPEIEVVTQNGPFQQTENLTQETSLYNTDYMPSFEPQEKAENDDFKIVIDETPTPQASMGIKLKFDDNILTPAPQVYSSIDEIKMDDLDFVASLEHYPDDKQEDLLNDTNLSINDIKIKKKDIETHNDFDLSAIADELGLDISMLAQILSEYIEEIDLKMPIIQVALEQSDFDTAQDETQKLKSVTHHLRILSLYNQFEFFEDTLANKDFKTSKEAFSTLSQTIKSFKDTIQ